MDLFSFTAHFGTEEDCRIHFKAQRDKIGVVCKCGHNEHFWIHYMTKIQPAKNQQIKLWYICIND